MYVPFAVVWPLPAEGADVPVDEAQRKTLKPEAVVVVPALPKTRSGKIMRRVVRAAWLGLDPGDLSALDDPTTIEAIRRAGPAGEGSDG